MQFKIEAVCISDKKGIQKHAVDKIQVLKDFGIKDDAHSGKWHRQVSLLAGEDIDTMKAKGLILAPGAFGENIITRGIDWSKVNIGDLITIDDVKLEITQIGKECSSPCAIYYTVGECIMPLKGIFTKVLNGGVISAKSRGNYSI